MNGQLVVAEGGELSVEEGGASREKLGAAPHSLKLKLFSDVTLKSRHSTHLADMILYFLLLKSSTQMLWYLRLLHTEVFDIPTGPWASSLLFIAPLGPSLIKCPLNIGLYAFRPCLLLFPSVPNRVCGIDAIPVHPKSKSRIILPLTQRFRPCHVVTITLIPR